MANDLSGVVFQETLLGETKASTEASEIAEVYNTAVKQLSQLWNVKIFDGWDVRAIYILGHATAGIEAHRSHRLAVEFFQSNITRVRGNA